MKTRQRTCVYVFLLVVALVVWAIPGACQASNSPTQPVGEPQVNGTSAITGEWQGTIGRQHMVVRIDQPPAGPMNGTLIVLDQGNASLPIDIVSFDESRALRLELKRLGAVYEGMLSADESEITGTWQQGGTSVPLVLRRPGAAAGRLSLKPRKQGRIAFDPCRTSDGNVEALCGKYEVYENRQLRTGRKIALNIMLLPATTEKAEHDPFFALAGGPGQSAIETFPPAGFVSQIRQHRDVVLVDQRGTGKSNPLQCSLQNLDDAQSVLGEPYALEKIRECRAETENVADTTNYTTSIAADDLDEVRQAMGYDKINVFGGSYGAKAALVYLRLHGEHVRTVGLEAVAAPQYLLPLPFAGALQSSIDGVIDLCTADAACNKDYPDFGNEFRAVIERLGKSPAHFRVKNQSVTLSREMFLSKLRSLLYFPQFVSALPLMVHSAYESNWSPYANAVLTLTGALDGVVARGASFAAICAEDVPGLTEAMIQHDTRGTYLGDSQVRRYQKYCQAWGTAGSVPKGFYVPVHSQVPTLLISGVLDPATPPTMAEEAARYLANSRLVAVKQGTHGTGSPCIDGLIADFVKQGSAKTLDASCADGIHLLPFVGPSAVGRSLQKPAREQGTSTRM